MTKGQKETNWYTWKHASIDSVLRNGHSNEDSTKDKEKWFSVVEAKNSAYTEYSQVKSFLYLKPAFKISSAGQLIYEKWWRTVTNRALASKPGFMP